MKPQEVKPENFEVHEVVYTSPDGYFSIAKGEWLKENTFHFALRWNGELNDKNDIGYPSAFGHPMWFLLPADIKGVLQALIANGNPIIL